MFYRVVVLCTNVYCLVEAFPFAQWVSWGWENFEITLKARVPLTLGFCAADRSIHFYNMEYPLVSNCFTYGCMCLGAEFSQQFINKRILHPKVPAEKIDIDALKRYAVYGFTICPNILYFWYKWLDKTFGAHTSTKIIARKVILGQFLMTPTCYVLFYTSMSLMERKSDILAECKAKFIPTFLTSCTFWIPANTINFWLVPAPLRIVYTGSCSFLWTYILCCFKKQELE